MGPVFRSAHPVPSSTKEGKWGLTGPTWMSQHSERSSLCRAGPRDNLISGRSLWRIGILRPALLSCILLILLPQCCLAVTPLSDWRSGIATNYGGPADGKNPYDPSWGTLTVCPTLPCNGLLSASILLTWLAGAQTISATVLNAPFFNKSWNSEVCNASDAVVSCGMHLMHLWSPCRGAVGMGNWTRLNGPTGALQLCPPQAHL